MSAIDFGKLGGPTGLTPDTGEVRRPNGLEIDLLKKAIQGPDWSLSFKDPLSASWDKGKVRRFLQELQTVVARLHKKWIDAEDSRKYTKENRLVDHYGGSYNACEPFGDRGNAPLEQELIQASNPDEINENRS